MRDFVHLHLHSEYSLLDGACRVSDIPLAARDAGQRAVAITDHGNMYGAVKFYLACKSCNIKPIIGCEVYVAPGSRFDRTRDEEKYFHLVLLAKNDEGYRNLIYLVSKGYTEGFYSRPRIDLALLSEHSAGLVCLSGCIAGYLPRMLLAENYDEAVKNVREMKSLFGDDYYIELQNHGIAEERTVLSRLIGLAEKEHVALVATNDVHYLEKSDAEVQSVLVCIQTNSRLSDGRPLGFEEDEFYLKTGDEMESLFSSHPEAIENTVKIAEKCNFDFEFGKLKLPVFSVPEGMTASKMLRDLSERGLCEYRDSGMLELSSHTFEDYKFRMIYELMMIEKMGYCGYYLIVRDFVMYAKESRIPTGPGRGSGCGSLIAYLLRITEIDPLKYDLLFERFLNPERVSMPDFDIDFCYERRDEVIRYVGEKYGRDRVSQIAAFGTLAARAAVRDVGRALGMPYNDIDRTAKLIPHRMDVTISSALETPELMSLYKSDPQVRRLLDISKSLEGMPRHLTTHAAGVVITENDVDTYVPLTVSGEAVLTQFEMTDIEKLGLLKFDFLAIRYLTVIDRTEKLIRKTEPDFSVTSIPLDDPDTYRLLSNADTAGVFQLESPGMRRLLSSLAPRRIEDIMIAIALYRPGPMDSIPRYLENRSKEKLEYGIPALEEILSGTSGCIVYQEQVMQIFRKVAGYSYGKADMIRRIMAKKKTDQMEKERAGFIDGARANGVAKEEAEKLFDSMSSFASYAFNKSHAAAYSYTSYRTAYLKAHYPAQYFASLLTSVSGVGGKTAEYISDCMSRKIKVLPPDVNLSARDFTADGGDIRFGLSGVKNIGTGVIDAIILARGNTGFSSFEDFISRTFQSVKGINKQQIYSLICSGAFDSFGKKRSQLLSVYESMIDDVSAVRQRNIDGQTSIFDSGSPSGKDATPLSSTEYPDIPEMPLISMLALEREMTGLCFSGHLLDDYTEDIASRRSDRIADILASFDIDSESVIGNYTDRQSVCICGIIMKIVRKQTKNGEDMAFLTVEDRAGEIEVVLFPKLMASCEALAYEGLAVCVRGNLSSKEDESPKILASAIEALCRNGKTERRSDEHEHEHEHAPVPKEMIKKGKGARLFIRVPSVPGDEYNRCRAVCEIFEEGGNTRVMFFDSSCKKYIDSGIDCCCSDFVVAKLASIAGESSVVVK